MYKIIGTFFLFISLLLCGCLPNPKPAEKTTTFSKPAWDTSNFENRGYMMDDLLAKKDSLLKDHSKEQVFALLGKPDETVNNGHYCWFFEKRYDNGMVILSQLAVRFDTVHNKARDIWWTD